MILDNFILADSLPENVLKEARNSPDGVDESTAKLHLPEPICASKHRLT